MRVSRWFRLATGLSLLGIAGCYGPGAIVDDYPASYALLYGTVRDSAQAPVVNAMVVSESGGVRTDAAGRYRLPTVTMGISGGIVPSRVMVYRMGTLGPPTDSTSVAALIPFFSSNPPPDSLRVDVVVRWKQ